MTDRVILTETYKTGKGAGIIVAESGKVRGPYKVTVVVGDREPKTRKIKRLGEARAALRGKLGPLRKAKNPNEVIRLVLGEGERATVSETVNPQQYTTLAEAKRAANEAATNSGVAHSVGRPRGGHYWVMPTERLKTHRLRALYTAKPGRQPNPLNKYYFQRGTGGLIRRKGKPYWVGSLDRARAEANRLSRLGRGGKVTILRVEPDGDQMAVGSVGNPVSKAWRVNYGQGQVDYVRSEKEGQDLIDRDPDPRGAFIQFKDPDTGEWFSVSSRRGGRKRNPSNMADADRLYEDFHGRPPTQTTRVVTRTKARTDLAELGPLTELKIHLLTGKRVKLPYEVDCADQVMLCSSPDGRQLYFVGGDQTIDLRRLGMSGREWVKDSMVLGVLEMVTYRTEKGFDKFKLTDYYHELGEESGMQPLLMYDNINGLLSVAGGRYEVRPEGIVN